MYYIMFQLNVDELDNLVLLINKSSNEKERRILLNAASKVYGYGGLGRVKALTNIAYSTLKSGSDLEASHNDLTDSRIRKPGGGRKKATSINPEIKKHIAEIIDGYEIGNPENDKDHRVGRAMSLRKIADTLLSRFGIEVNYVTVQNILDEMHISKQVNRKEEQVGKPDPDRNKQFEFIIKTQHEYLDSGNPVISVDTKKKENIGNFKNDGKEYRPEKQARRTLDHDFPLAELGKVSPYGIYVLNDNTGFVNLGTDHDTSAFAAESIRRWWDAVGKPTFPKAKRLYITCDGGGSNGSRSRAWKCELQELANYSGLEIMVSHYPPGTSKWNKIEHRMFCYITKNWHGKPLIDIETVIYLIGSTTTQTGLKIKCVVDKNEYPTGRKVSDDELEKVNIFPCEILGKWNYVIKPI